MILILAGVTIATLTGDNGLLQKATNAKETSTDAEICEKIKLAYADYYSRKYEKENATFRNALEVMFGKENIADVKEEIEDYTIIFKNAVPYILYKESGVVEKKDNKIGSLITKINYGNSIDLGQNVVRGTDTNDDWKILYNDKKNNIVYAILSDYLPNSNSAVIKSGLKGGGTHRVYSSKSNDDLLTKLSDTNIWKSLISENLWNSVQVKGAVPIETIVASYNEKYGTNFKYTDKPYFRTNPNNTSSPIDNLYMPRPGNSPTYDCWGYWVDLPDNYEGTDLWTVHIYGDLKSGYKYDDGSRGICPVALISSGTKVTSETVNGEIIWSLVQ